MNNEVLGWDRIPEANFISEALRERAILLAKIRRQNLEISLEEAEISKRKPRDKMARLAGIDKDANDGKVSKVVALRYELLDLQDALDLVEADIKMFEFRKDIFKAISYKERM